MDSRAFVFILLGRWDEAFADADAALKANPENAYALFERGVVRLRNGDPAAGRADIEASRALDAGVEKEFAGLGVML